MYIKEIDLRPLKKLQFLRIRARVHPDLLNHLLPQISSPSLSLLVVAFGKLTRRYRPFFDGEPWKAQLHKYARLFALSPVLRSVNRVVFANDLAPPPKYVAEEDAETSGEEEVERQTVNMLRWYLDEAFEGEMCSLKYEVMSFADAKRLGGAVPIENVSYERVSVSTANAYVQLIYDCSSSTE